MSKIVTQDQGNGKASSDPQVRPGSFVRELQNQIQELKSIVKSAAQDGVFLQGLFHDGLLRSSEVEVRCEAPSLHQARFAVKCFQSPKK